MNLKFISTFALLLWGGIALNAQSESEPNNTTSTANVVGINDCISADLWLYDDIDFFKVTAPKGGVIKIKMVNVPSTVRLEVDFYNSGGSTIVSSDAYKKGLEVFMEAVVPAGDYFLRVNDYYNGVAPYGSFSICFSFDDEDAFEFNNSFALAATVPFDSCFAAKLWGRNYKSPNSVTNDRDYYKFSIDRGGVVNFSVTDVPIEFVLLLKIYDKDLNYITDWKGDFGWDINFNAILKEGDYFFTISEFKDELKDKAFKVCLTFDSSEVWEYNNTASRATLISPDSCFKGKIKGFETLGSSRASDLDIFRFRLSQGGLFKAVVSSVPINIEMVVTVYDSSLKFVDTEIGGEGLPMSFSKHLCEGLYYVLLNDRNFYAESNDFYSVCFDFEKDEECYNSFDFAYAVPVCDTIKAALQSAGDKDYFEFLGSGKDVKVRLFDVPANIKAKLSLFDFNKMQIGSSVIGSANGDDIEIALSNSSFGDKYFVVVEAVNPNFNLDKYSLAVLDDGCLPLPPPPVSVNDLNSENLISVYPNPSNGEIFISSASGEVLNIEIFNALGQLVFADDDYNGEAITLNTPDGVYWVKMVSERGIFQKKLLLQAK